MSNDRTLDGPKKGDRWLDKNGRQVRVLCDPHEGYVMWRYKGCMVDVRHVNDWHAKFPTRVGK